MKILFVCYEYCGNRDAGSQCIHELRGELHKRHIQSDVLTYDWTGHEQSEQTDAFGSIYAAKTWYRFSRVQRNTNGRVSMSLRQWMRVIVARLAAMLLEGKSYAQRGMPVAATCALQKRLSALCRQNQYDWVVSVSYPFANHLATIKACFLQTKIALYNLDPYWNNQTYNSNKSTERRNEEATVYEKANIIFCTPEQLPDYQNESFAAVKHKIFPLNYPNFIPPKLNLKSEICFDPNKISLLYLGTIYSDIRKPEALFKLFEQAVQKEPRLHLYIIGKKFGPTAEKYLVEYQRKLGGYLSVYSPVPIEETADLLQQADILVNLGNTMHNQMPSKTLAYLAAGKPILNISARKDCNTLPLIRRYPLAFQYAGRDLCEKRVDDFVRFCRENKGKSLQWDEVSAIYPDMQLSSVTSRFLDILSDGKTSGQEKGGNACLDLI